MKFLRLVTAAAVMSLAAGSSLAQNDPFLREQLDFGPVSPDHYKTFQWHLGFRLYGPYNDIQVAGAWLYTPGHAYLGFLDAGISTWTGAGPTLVVDPPHEDLAANFREHLSPSFGIDLRAALGTAAFGHGMHVMGLAAGTTNNSKGIAGVCRGCSTILGNVGLTEELSTPVLNGVVQSGAQVINISFENTSAPLVNFITGLAVQRDLVVVAAAGNDGNGTPDYPASHPSVIGVAGSAPNGFRWDESFACRQLGECASNFGGNVQLAAPALNVVSAWYPGNNYSSNPANNLCGDALHGSQTNGGTIHISATDTDGYGACTGTSMSAPIVTGVAGLVRSVNPLLSAAEVRSILQNTARFTGDATLGRGIVSAQGSVLATLGVSNAVTVNNRLTPLFSLYSAGAGDYLYTTVPQMASAAINDTGRRKYSSTSNPTAVSGATPYVSRGADPPVAGYGAFPGGNGQLPRAAVFVFTGPTPPVLLGSGVSLVPLYRLSYVDDWTKKYLNNRDHTYTTDAAGIAAYQSVGYKLDGIEGYIYAKTTSVAGTVKLLRRYHPGRDDHAIFPESQLAAMLAEGYTQLSGSDWLGWVYPNVDSDGDGLIDGFEAVLGTNRLGVDTDLDGRWDGVEYPLADPPVSDPRRF